MLENARMAALRSTLTVDDVVISPETQNADPWEELGQALEPQLSTRSSFSGQNEP
jgi:hypothetical protein